MANNAIYLNDIQSHAKPSSFRIRSCCKQLSYSHSVKKALGLTIGAEAGSYVIHIIATKYGRLAKVNYFLYLDSAAFGRIHIISRGLRMLSSLYWRT